MISDIIFFKYILIFIFKYYHFLNYYILIFSNNCNFYSCDIKYFDFFLIWIYFSKYYDYEKLRLISSDITCFLIFISWNITTFKIVWLYSHEIRYYDFFWFFFSKYYDFILETLQIFFLSDIMTIFSKYYNFISEILRLFSWL